MANFKLSDTQKVPYTVIARDANLAQTDLPAGDVIVISSDTAAATIVPDAVPLAGFAASGFIVSGSKPTLGVVITAQAMKADGTPDPSITNDVVLIDVVSAPATSLSLVLGAAVGK